MNCLEDLNEQQLKAVTTTSGPVMIIAGPGTGKTKTLTSRIAYLTKEKQIPLESILALTFTQKAATEMRERLTGMIGKNLPLTTTFHSLGYKILSSTGHRIELITERYRNEIINDIKNKLHLTHISNKELSLVISLYKSSFNKGHSVLTPFIDEYNNYLNKTGLYDYDDLLLKTFNVLKGLNSPIKTFHYFLIDEFQDTNPLQYEIIKLLLDTHRNLFVIGDPLQSIYSFRGAHSEIFQQMLNDFPETITITLKENYRSFGNIIEISSILFPDAPKLTSHFDKKGQVKLVKTMHEYSEADWIVNDICTKVGGIDLIQAGEKNSVSTNCRFSDFAVIYRAHHINNLLEERFSESGIPYQIIGGDSPYELLEVSFIIEVMSYLLDKNDDYLKDIINSKIINISDLTSKNITINQKDHNCSVMEAILLTLKQNDLSDKQRILLQQFIDNLQTIEKPNKEPLSTLIAKIIECFHISVLIKDSPLKSRAVVQFQNTMLQFDTQSKPLQKAVEYIRYLQEHEFYDPTSDKVTLLTMHAAKGLEFRHVYICGFEEDIIPIKNTEDLEEEKRLLYVAITRAKEELVLLYTKNRFKKPVQISRFFNNIDSSYLFKEDDPAIELIEKKRKKWKEKKSQMTLF